MSERKKQTILLFFPAMFLMVGMVWIFYLFYHAYQQTAYRHVSAFCETVMENSPEVEQLLLSGLKEYRSLSEQEITRNSYLGQYGYRTEEFCKGMPDHVSVSFMMLFFMSTGSFVFVVWAFGSRSKKRIGELTGYLERINTGVAGTIMQLQEDEFSGLQDEMYKTVTTLCQTREAAVSAKEKFAENLANIAHQLKTPITAASLSLQLMQKEKVGEYAGQIEKQLKRLNCLEEALLMLSKIDAGTLLLKHENVDLYTALNLAAENLNELLREKGIFIEIPENGCIEFCGDLEWTMEAIINLMKNCMEHSKPGGVVHCEYSYNPLYVQVKIWDDGAGFDSEDLPYLFERFYRGKHMTGNGIGIGLSLARSIFELQNGTIAAYNRKDGGACFEVRLYSH